MTRTTIFKSQSEEETRAIGFEIAKTLLPGDVVGLSGEFGAGKTRLIKAICEYFNISPSRVTSPSFTLIHEYQGTHKIVHLDTYRLASDGDFELLDLDYYLDQKAIILIEWAGKVEHLLPESTRWIEIRVDGPTKRTLHFTGKKHD